MLIISSARVGLLAVTLLSPGGAELRPAPAVEAVRTLPARIRVTFVGGRKRDVNAVERLPGGGLRLRLVEGGVQVVEERWVLSWQPLDPGAAARLASVRDLPRRCYPDAPQVTRWTPIAAQEAALHGLPRDLVLAIIAVESCGDPRAVSRAGAMGLMQLMPATARQHGCDDPFDPRANIRAGCQHVVMLQRAYPDDLDRVLAAYNGGPGSIGRDGVPRYAETRRYVKLVRAHLERLQSWGGRARRGALEGAAR